MPSSAPLCPNLTFNAQMCPRTLQCTTKYVPTVPSNMPLCPSCTLQYTNMPPLYTVYRYVPLFILQCMPLHPPRLFRYALISQYAYSLIGSPPQPIQSCCLYFSWSSPEVSHALWKLKKELTQMSQQKNFCVSNIELCQWIEGRSTLFLRFFMGNH